LGLTREVRPKMMSVIGASLLLSVGAPEQKEITYSFATEHYVIEMAVSFLEPYRGRPLVFYSGLGPRKEVCYSGDGETLGKCPERFVGAVAIVRYSVRHWNGKPPVRAAIREHVTIIAQSDDLPERSPFSKTQELVNGAASDIQVFGYDEAGMKKSDLARTRGHARQKAWRLYRQELYMDSEAKPFAIVEWKHTVDRIGIVKVYSPAPGRY
jgi:hypothetical protein